MKAKLAIIFGWGQFVLVLFQQASNGHFPQNKSEWVHLLSSVFIAAALHHAATTDGTK